MQNDSPGPFVGFQKKIISDLLNIWGFNSPEARSFAGRIASAGCGILNKDPTSIAIVKAWRGDTCQGYLTSRSFAHPVAQIFSVSMTSSGSVCVAAVPPYVLYSITQALLMFWKCEFPLQTVSWQGFKQRVSRSGHPTFNSWEYAHMRKYLRLGTLPRWESLAGRNGPGAVAGGQKGADKWFFVNRPKHIPLMFYCYSVEQVPYYDWSDTCKYGVTRALQVPKDVRGPRFISCEPLAYAHAQFALESELRAIIRRHYSEHVCLEDQQWHNRLMHDLHGRVATIDLSDASDYVSRRLVWNLFPESWRAALFAARSSFTAIDEDIIPIRSFAPMGSALCFVVMTLVIVVLLKSAGIKRFHVYGDDIILPISDYPKAINVLSRAGLQVNNLKSCSTGYFVESCGTELVYNDDAYVNVTPIYVRSLALSEAGLLGLLRTGITLRRYGFVEFGASLIETAVKLSFPSFKDGVVSGLKVRWNAKYQQKEYKVPVEVPVALSSTEVDDRMAIYKWFTSPSRGVLSTRENPFSSGPTCVRWVWLSASGFPEWVSHDAEYRVLDE